MDAGTGLGLASAAAYDGVLALLSFMESRGLRALAPEIHRRPPERLIVGRENHVRLELHNRADRRVRLRVRDTLPASFKLAGSQALAPDLEVDLPAHARRELSYAIVPTRRGRFAFGDLHLQLEGPLGVGDRRLSVPAHQQARVFPDVLGLRGEELMTRVSDLRTSGTRNVRKLGGGGEFAQLREYVPGDAFRDIDWKSTAKRRRPVTRVYEQERSQSVLLCLDVGRMMAARLTEDDHGVVQTKLDHALKAALLLAWVALRDGDQVGVLLFAEGVREFVPPGRGPAQYRRILEAVFDAEAQPTFVNVRALVAFVRARVPRRSLVMIFSDLLDDEHAMPLAESAAVLRQRHLPVCVTLDEPVASYLADAPVRLGSGEDSHGKPGAAGAGSSDAEDESPEASASFDPLERVFARAAAADLLKDRERVKAHLQKSGVGLVEAPASKLAVSAVRRYLEIKARRTL